ncbi:MAG: DUF1275 domain-containing protein [Halioglobus sp.]|nr:DUF1275 domain-containing protein [Halioglobus sp.]
MPSDRPASPPAPDAARRLRLPPFLTHIRSLYMISGVCGLVDAVCFLSLGEVFAEMMTGNLLLIAFYAGTGHPPEAYAANAMAVAAFVFGAVIAGRIVRGRLGHTRLGFFIEWGFLNLAVVFSLMLPLEASELARFTLICTLAFAMGMQNALIRRHGVPDLATNVMTLTLTALVADSTLAGGENERWRRRSASIAVFVAGALLGALLTTRVAPWAPLLAALALFTLALPGLTRHVPAPPAASPA